MKILTPATGLLVCGGCTRRHDSTQGIAWGWIDEDWPTISGGMVHVTICPGCRHGGYRHEGDTQWERLL